MDARKALDCLARWCDESRAPWEYEDWVNIIAEALENSTLKQAESVASETEDYELYKAIDGWVKMIAEMLKLLRQDDPRYWMLGDSEYHTWAAELVGCYRREEDWRSSFRDKVGKFKEDK